MLGARSGKRIRVACHDPLMRLIDAEVGLLSDGTAVVEMAAASGLVLLAPGERDPLVATTYGTGELVAAALDRRAREIIVGVGGSATVDAGAGAMQALGARLLDGEGRELSPGGGALSLLDRIDVARVDARLHETRLRVASDVRNLLYGEDGAAVMFGPQKGASPDDVRALDAALEHFAAIVKRDCGVDVASIPGSGAAGGLGAGLVALCGAKIESGFDLVADVTHLAEAIASCDAVITGEGRLDAQSQFGKTTAGVARVAQTAGKRAGIIAGTVAEGYASDGSFEEIEEVTPPGTSVEEAIRDAMSLVQEAAARIARRLV
jgi:glycerate kinase